MLNPNTVLVLRTCNKDLKSTNGFQWPAEGMVEVSDWDPKPECGNGLHGLLWGEGNGTLLNWDINAKWLVVEVEADQIVDLNGKVKFPKGIVVHCGTQLSATNYMLQHAPGRGVVGATVVVGHHGTATVGNCGTAQAGHEGTAMAGHYGKATAGNWGTATAGNWGTATAGNWGTAMAGDEGTSTAGHYGKATAGNWGTAMAGHYGKATAGNWGTLIFKWHDGKRYRLATFYVGEDGIEANVAYKCIDGKAMKVAK